jgi:hypothetical protein
MAFQCRERLEVDFYAQVGGARGTVAAGFQCRERLEVDFYQLFGQAKSTDRVFQCRERLEVDFYARLRDLQSHACRGLVSVSRTA